MTEQNPKHYIGLDVSKDKIDVSIAPKKYFVIDNSPEGFAKLFDEIKKLEQAKKLTGTPFLVLEETGIYGLALCLEADKQKIEHACVSASRVKYFKKSENELAKTDKIDAHMIRRYGEEKKPKPQSAPTKTAIKMRELRNHLWQLTKSVASFKNLLEATTLPECRLVLKQTIDMLEKRIEKVEKDLEKIIDSDPEMLAKKKFLLSFYGIAKKTAEMLVIGMPELGKVNRQKIAALLGVAPRPNDSGKHNGKRTCFGGRGDIRAKFYMPTVRAIGQPGSVLQKYHTRLSKRLRGKVLIVCCMRKFIQYLNSEVAKMLAEMPAHNLSQPHSFCPQKN